MSCAADFYRRRDELEVERKGTQDLVSEADRACEDMIVGALSRLFPEDGFLGEERGIQKAGAKAVWIIDPIDGTANFLRGIPFWCVSVGLLTAGAFVIGVIYNPITDELFAARQGQGATLNGQHDRSQQGEDRLRMHGLVSASAIAGQSLRMPRRSGLCSMPIASIAGSDQAHLVWL